MTSLFIELIDERSKREIAFHENAGSESSRFFSGFVKQSLFSRRVATVAMVPSALSRSDSFRSVHVGRSRCSRCCHLIIALWFCSWRLDLGQAINAVTGTRLWLLFFLLKNVFTLCRCRHCSLLAVAQRFISLRPPTDDAATRPVCVPWRRWLASFRFSHRA